MRDHKEDLAGKSDEETMFKKLRGGSMYQLFLAKAKGYIKSTKTSNEYDYLDISRLANDLNMTRQNVYAWFYNNRLPPERVRAILALPGNELTMDDLLPFVLKD